LTDELFEKLAKASLDNAKSLQVDARILLEHEKYARSFALSVLAIEEMSKSYWCKMASVGVLSPEFLGESNTKQVKKWIFKDHRFKQLSLSLLLAFLNLLAQNPEGFSDIFKGKTNLIPNVDYTQARNLISSFRKLDRLKQTAFYVGYDQDELSIPDEEMKREQASIIEVVQMLIPRIESLINVESPYDLNLLRRIWQRHKVEAD
jgi:AbiV family abortive infection protein